MCQKSIIPWTISGQSRYQTSHTPGQSPLQKSKTYSHSPTNWAPPLMQSALPQVVLSIKWSNAAAKHGRVPIRICLPDNSLTASPLYVSPCSHTVRPPPKISVTPSFALSLLLHQWLVLSLDESSLWPANRFLSLLSATTHGLCPVTRKAAAGPLKQKIGSP